MLRKVVLLTLIVLFGGGLPLAYAQPCMMKMPTAQVENCHHEGQGQKAADAKVGCRVVADCFQQDALSSDITSVAPVAQVYMVPALEPVIFSFDVQAIPSLAQAPPERVDIPISTRQTLATLSRWLI